MSCVCPPGRARRSLALANVSCPQVDVYIFEPNGISRVQTQHELGQKFNDFISVTKTKNKVRLAGASGC